MTEDVVQAEPTDSVLIRQFLNGNEGAFRSLYRRHTPRLRMTVLRLVGYRDADADDVLQDTWLACCRALHTFRGEARFDTWLTTIGLRTAKRELTRAFAGGDCTDSTGLLTMPQEPPPLDASIDAERALQRLSERDRIVFTLHYLEGFSHDDIARELGIATGTSRAILSRALTALRAHYHVEVSYEK